MEELTPLEDSVTDVFLPESVDQTTLECISFEQSDASGLPNSRKAPLRTSRRRVQKNTAVVLNADRLKRINLDESTLSALEQSVVEHSSYHEDNKDDKKDEAVLQALPIAIQRIATWWRKIRAKGSLSRPPALGSSLHRKLFALLLGHRVRRLMRGAEVKAIRTAHRDVCNVLLELLPPAQTSPASAPAPPAPLLLSPTLRIEQWRGRGKLPSMSDVDHALALSLYRQMLSEREKLLAVVFRQAVWLPVPAPGYWKLHVVGQAKKQRGGSLLPSPSPERARREPLVQDTPPHLKHALISQKAKIPVKLFVNRHNSRLIDEESLGEIMGQPAQRSHNNHHTEHVSNNNSSHSKSKPQSLHALLETKSLPPDERPISLSTIHEGGQGLGGLGQGRESLGGRKAGAGMTGGGAWRGAGGSAAERGVVRSVRKRGMACAHIQLDILSGEKLMPARKGVSSKDSHVEPDRRPCLKVSLYLPSSASSSASASSSSVLKKVYQESRDFDTLTLSPVWNTSFFLPLPLPRAFLPTEEREADGEREEESYRALCQRLASYYAQGKVVVEVQDKERFNESLFLGQVSLLLSSFLLSGRRKRREGESQSEGGEGGEGGMELGGRYQLEKEQSRDRVSGCISLQAYLHLPERGHVEEVRRERKEERGERRGTRRDRGRRESERGEGDGTGKGERKGDRRGSRGERGGESRAESSPSLPSYPEDSPPVGEEEKTLPLPLPPSPPYASLFMKEVMRSVEEVRREWGHRQRVREKGESGRSRRGERVDEGGRNRGQGKGGGETGEGREGEGGEGEGEGEREFPQLNLEESENISLPLSLPLFDKSKIRHLKASSLQRKSSRRALPAPACVSPVPSTLLSPPPPSVPPSSSASLTPPTPPLSSEGRGRGEGGKGSLLQGMREQLEGLRGVEREAEQALRHYLLKLQERERGEREEGVGEQGGEVKEEREAEGGEGSEEERESAEEWEREEDREEEEEDGESLLLHYRGGALSSYLRAIERREEEGEEMERGEEGGEEELERRNIMESIEEESPLSPLYSEEEEEVHILPSPSRPLSTAPIPPPRPPPPPPRLQPPLLPPSLPPSEREVEARGEPTPLVSPPRWKKRLPVKTMELDELEL